MFTDDMAAKAAAVFFGHGQPGSAVAFREALEVFAPLATAEAREECARIADGYARRAMAANPSAQEAAVAAEHIAEAIRRNAEAHKLSG